MPDPHGPLAKTVPSTSIAAANSEILEASNHRLYFKTISHLQTPQLASKQQRFLIKGVWFKLWIFYHEIARVLNTTKILPHGNYPLYLSGAVLILFPARM